MVSNKPVSEMTPEKPDIEILSKKMPEGEYAIKDCRITLKDDTYGNPEFAFFNDGQILYVTQGNPNKFKRNNASFDSLMKYYEELRNYKMNVEFSIKEWHINGDVTKSVIIKHISKIEKIEHADDIVIDDLTESNKPDDKLKYAVEQKIKTADIGVTIEELTQIANNPVVLNSILKELKDNGIIEMHNGLVKYIAQKTL